MNQADDKKEVFWSFDFLKIVLAFIVVIRHVVQNECHMESFCYIAVVNIVSPVAVPMFFAISGFLLFKNGVTKEKIIHQIKRILYLYFSWTIIYLPLSIYGLLSQGYPIHEAMWRYIQELVFSGSYYHLWFLPALVFGIIFVWILDRNIKPIKQFVIVAVLFIMGVILVNFNGILPSAIRNISKMYCLIFVTFRNGLFFGSLFVWVGKYLATDNRRLNNFELIKYSMGLFVSFVGLIFEGLLMSKLQKGFVGNMLLFSAPLVFILLKLILHINQSICCKLDTSALRKMSTVIFCVHPIVMIGISFLQKFGLKITLIGFICVTILICIVLALCCIKLLPKIRVLKYFI